MFKLFKSYKKRRQAKQQAMILKDQKQRAKHLPKSVTDDLKTPKERLEYVQLIDYVNSPKFKTDVGQEVLDRQLSAVAWQSTARMCNKMRRLEKAENAKFD